MNNTNLQGINPLDKSSSIISNNGWQNIGICVQHIRKQKLTGNITDVYLYIVQESFGYGKLYTNRQTQIDMANSIGISRPTLTKAIHELSSLGLISINESNKYIVDGGSEAFSYSPSFPTGIGKIWIKQSTSGSSDNNTISTQSEPDVDDTDAKMIAYYKELNAWNIKKQGTPPEPPCDFHF
jgi:predicted transcriptional regulator